DAFKAPPRGPSASRGAGETDRAGGARRDGAGAHRPGRASLLSPAAQGRLARARRSHGSRAGRHGRRLGEPVGVSKLRSSLKPEVGGPPRRLKGTVKFARIVLAVALAALAASCREKAKTAGEAARRFPFKGIVRQVDSARSEVTVEHDAIPNFMDGMTMNFPVRDDPQVMRLIRPGDRIEATLVV